MVRESIELNLTVGNPGFSRRVIIPCMMTRWLGATVRRFGSRLVRVRATAGALKTTQVRLRLVVVVAVATAVVDATAVVADG